MMDGTSQINWQLAAIEGVITVPDGLMGQLIIIHTKSGETNHPIALLYLLEDCLTEILKLTPMMPKSSDIHKKNRYSSQVFDRSGVQP